MNIRRFTSISLVIWACAPTITMANTDVVACAKAPNQNINALSEEGFAPLHKAVQDEKIEDVKSLLSAGADVNVPDSFKRTPLLWAAIRGNTEIMRVLLEAKADVDIKCCYGLTALHDAARGLNRTAVELLLKAHANPFIKDDRGNTPLAFATRIELPEKKQDYIAICMALSTEMLQKNRKELSLIKSKMKSEKDSEKAAESKLVVGLLEELEGACEELERACAEYKKEQDKKD